PLSPHTFFYSYDHPRELHSFPTRRSSDLAGVSLSPPITATARAVCPVRKSAARNSVPSSSATSSPACKRPQCGPGATRRARSARSEEHTSELQSQSNLVCRLLLEKKKQKE